MHRAVRIILPGIWLSSTLLVWPSGARAQNDAEKIYKTNCVLCHAPDGSGSTPTGKALKAEDLRSDVVQKETDAELTAAITNDSRDSDFAASI